MLVSYVLLALACAFSAGTFTILGLNWMDRGHGLHLMLAFPLAIACLFGTLTFFIQAAGELCRTGGKPDPHDVGLEMDLVWPVIPDR